MLEKLLCLSAAIHLKSVAAGLSINKFMGPLHLYPDCTCNCCYAAPDPYTSEGFAVCVTPGQLDAKCEPLCKSKDSIISNAHKNENGQRLLNYERFCKYECKSRYCNPPTPNMMQCIPLEPSEIQGAKTPPFGGGQVSKRNCEQYKKEA
eukprot:gnl/MRDRNA2_/MRDRNA2_98755_c0_seq1.p1 gnl/MRDRNA2_/MRDRNA2_98755_c0~~gnl/MRDRNA2_/MRDRNA2_98755_c0_seq1.p1  ORF type:complete len:149 (-),score=15.97 gnl/MRDRNA2_/MRDRNA2_98755_c0_seq1:51-497(-)